MTRGAVAVTLASLCGLVASAPLAAPLALPRCFGAAARDPLHSCHNRHLRLTVTPTPSEAVLVPNAPCTEIDSAVNACAFGVPEHEATATIGLVGNSHAGHWRATLAAIADAMRWQGVSITRASCAFTRAVLDLPEPLRGQCSRWNANIPDWFDGHPDVHTIFVTNQDSPVIGPDGRSRVAAQVAGYLAAWSALPLSVEHIVVIRDTPSTRGDVLWCVERAMRKRESAGPRCAVPRRDALKPDPAVIAAAQLHSPRVQVIDMTHYFCGPRTCEPVIGGVLVYRDATHLTRSYATTLAPYLLRRIRSLVVEWSR